MSTSIDQQSSDLPDLAPGLRWSPEAEADENTMKASRGHNIVAEKPGYYRIDETSNSPITSIGKELRSNFGIATSESFDRWEINRQNLDQIDLQTDSSDEEGIGDENAAEQYTWRPYQEVCAISAQKHAGKSLSNSHGHSKHCRDISPGLVDASFTYSNPEEVFLYTIEGVREFHSERYSKTLRFVDNSGFDPISLLQPQALEVLLSGEYSREK